MTPRYFDEGYGDERIPCVLLSESRPRARKEHKCSMCPKTINPFQVYRRRFYLVDGEPTLEKVCSDCEAAEYGYGV